MFDRLLVKDAKVKRWIEAVIRAKAKDAMKQSSNELQAIQTKITSIQKDRDSLLTLRVHNEIDADTYKSKDGALLEQRNLWNAKLEGQGRQRSEVGDLIAKAFELSQTLKDKWVTADIAEKRLVLERMCLNLTLNDVTLDISLRKPFDALVEGLTLHIGSGGRI